MSIGVLRICFVELMWSFHDHFSIIPANKSVFKGLRSLKGKIFYYFIAVSATFVFRYCRLLLTLCFCEVHGVKARCGGIGCLNCHVWNTDAIQQVAWHLRWRHIMMQNEHRQIAARPWIRGRCVGAASAIPRGWGTAGLPVTATAGLLCRTATAGLFCRTDTAWLFEPCLPRLHKRDQRRHHAAPNCKSEQHCIMINTHKQC